MSTAAAIVSLDRVVKTYPGGYEALRGVSLDIATGEMLFLTGRSGAGKSTLLKLIGSIERPTRGSVVVNGQNIGKLPRRALPFLRRNLGLVFQDQKLLYDRSVFDNVALPLQVIGQPAKEAARRVRAALDRVGLLGRSSANPITLSGGEQQRLAIARAVVARPRLLIADEPTANLDAGYAKDIAEIFRSFNQVGVTVIIATHDAKLVERFASRTIALQDGQLI